MRHGKTEWNAMHKLQGQTDIPLNEEGRAMAQKAAEDYKEVNIDICYCSPLNRAAETARLFLQGRDIPIILDDRLKEMNFGECEGSLNYFTDSDSAINVLFKDPANYNAVKGGESLDEVFARTGELLANEILPKVKEEKDVLIVGHGAMNSTIICQLRGVDKSHLWDEPIENCRLIKLLD